MRLILSWRTFLKQTNKNSPLSPPPFFCQSTQQTILGWVSEAVKDWNLEGSAVGELDHGGRTTIQNKNYLQVLK